uniref:PPIase cyclophilin-type domain-containing protein n=1 Tax=Graphocephala atropunctata TaxID=36148 RepID=A0A1B6MCP5_9HEMI
MSGPQLRHSTDLKVYNKHLKNVREATAKTDNKAPFLPVSVYLKEANFYADITRLRNLELENRKLLTAINILYRTKGKVDCQLEKYERKRTKYVTEQAIEERERQRIEEFLEHLKYVSSGYNQRDMNKDWKRILKVMKFSAKYPDFYDKSGSHVDTWTLCPPEVSSDSTKHQVCYLDLRIGDLPKLSRLEIEVYSDIVPATAANFTSLCQGFSGLSYQGSILHRIVPDLLCLGGDIVNFSGTGGMSIYGPDFPDENFTLRHNGPGVVAMYTTGPDRNHSQFLITFKQLSSLNGKHVVIGRVKSSSLKVLKLIESCGTKSGKPLQVVRVEACGLCKR